MCLNENYFSVHPENRVPLTLNEAVNFTGRSKRKIVDYLAKYITHTSAENARAQFSCHLCTMRKYENVSAVLRYIISLLSASLGIFLGKLQHTQSVRRCIAIIAANYSPY